MFSLLPDNVDNETPLTDEQFKGWCFVIHQLHREQLPGLKKPLPPRPKTISNVLEWVENNHAASIRSDKLLSVIRPSLPLCLYFLGALWLKTIFSPITIAIYLLPAFIAIAWLLFLKRKKSKQIKRLIKSEHFEELTTKLTNLQQESLDKNRTKPASITTSEGLLFSYMQQTDNTDKVYHVLSFRSTIETLYPKTIALLTLIGKQCFPKAEAPIVFKTKKDIFHLLYTHTAESPLPTANDLENLDIEELLADLWIVRFHQEEDALKEENAQGEIEQSS